MNRRLARGIGVRQGAAEHFGGTRDVADLVVHVRQRDRGILLATGQRAYRGCDRRQRPHGAADHEQRREHPDQDAGGAEHDALPLGLGQRPREIARQHPPPPRAEFAQQFGDAPDQPALGAQHFLVELGDLGFRSRNRGDRVGIGVGCGAQRRIVDRQRAHALRRPLRRIGIVRQKRRVDLVLGPEKAPRDGPVGHRRYCRLEPLAHRRQFLDQIRPARDQGGDALNAFAVVLQPGADAIDHFLLRGREFESGFFQKRRQGGGGLADPVRPGALIGDEIARREPQLVHPPVDLLGEVADILQPLQLGEGRVDVPDRDDLSDTFFFFFFFFARCVRCCVGSCALHTRQVDALHDHLITICAARRGPTS